MNFQIQPSNFKEVLPLWRDHLWPNRTSEIEPTNPIVFKGGYNLDYLNRTPVFFKATVNNESKPIAAISGFETEPHEFRMRGIIILPEYARKGIGQRLFKAIEDHCKNNNYKRIWTLPRQANIEFYKNLGFTQVSDWIDDEFEFGPNCFVEILID